MLSFKQEIYEKHRFSNNHSYPLHIGSSQQWWPGLFLACVSPLGNKGSLDMNSVKKPRAAMFHLDDVA